MRIGGSLSETVVGTLLESKEPVHARHSLDRRHLRIFRCLDRLRSFLRPREVKEPHGRSIAHHAHHQRRNHYLSLLRPLAAGEILK